MIRGIAALRSWQALIACALIVNLPSGCALPKPQSLSLAGYEEFRRSSIGVVLLVPEKRVEFSERLYRVFFISQRANYYTFDGIWDPAPVLGEHAIKLLNSAHAIAAVPLWQRLEPGLYRELTGRLESRFTAARQAGTANAKYGTTAFGDEWNTKPPNAYLQASLPELKQSLQGAGIDQLLELSLGGISINSLGLGVNALLVFTYARLIRLSDGVVIWDAKGVGESRIANLEKYSQLEANNLALLKHHYEKAVMNLLDPMNTHNLFASLRPSP